jgi:hypothetical protein
MPAKRTKANDRPTDQPALTPWPANNADPMPKMPVTKRSKQPAIVTKARLLGYEGSVEILRPVFCRLVQVRNFEYIDCAALIEPISAMMIPYRSSSSSIGLLCSQVLAQVAPLAGRARSSGHRRALGRGG